MIRTPRLADRRELLKGLAGASLALACAGRGIAASLAPPKLPRFRGVFPIAFTPVDGTDRIDFGQLANQVSFLRRGKVPGIAWPQIASGWTVLSESERLQGAEALVAAGKGGDTAIVIGVQSPDFDAVQRYAAHAERIGADAIICLPPKDTANEAAVLDYYQKVGRLTELPFFVQAVGTMSVELLARIYETVPTMRYIKDESGEPLERVQELLRRTQGAVADFSGRGANTMISEMERGFAGACPYVSLADVYQASWEAWHAGDRQQAFRIFAAIQAANTMFAQSSVEALIARQVFRPGTRLRVAPPAAGAAPPSRYFPASTADEIRRVLDSYLKPYLRA